MSTAAITPQLETVDHPILGKIGFPVDMGPDERNESIQRAMMDKAQNPAASVPKPNVSVTSASEPHPILQRLTSGPSEDATVQSTKVPQSIIHAPDSLGEAIGGMAVGGGAAMAAAPIAAKVVPPVARVGLKAIKAHPILSTMALEAAKSLPIVGKYASKIPAWLPLLASGKEGAVAPESEALEGEEAASVPSTRKIASPQEVSTPAIGKSPLDDAYFAGPGPVIQRGPKIGSPQDIQETRGIQEEIRDAADAEYQTFASQQKRDWFARNQPGTPKGELTRIAKPTPTSNRGISARERTTIPQPDEDLTPILRKSLERVQNARR